MQLDGIRAIEHRLWRNPEVGACMQPDTYCWKYNLQAVCWCGGCSQRVIASTIYYHRQPLVLNKLFLQHSFMDIDGSIYSYPIHAVIYFFHFHLLNHAVCQINLKYDIPIEMPSTFITQRSMTLTSTVNAPKWLKDILLLGRHDM